MTAFTPFERAHAETQAAIWALALEAANDDLGSAVLAETYFQGWPADRKPTNREDWLHDFAHAARPYFHALGRPLPATLRIGVGWSSGGGRATSGLGECYYGIASADGARAIIITPGRGMDDASRVADVLTHELAHAALPEGTGHRGPFKALVTGLGLEGPATATTAGPAWHAWADEIISELGPYPHAVLDLGAAGGIARPGAGGVGGGFRTGRKTQTTRMLLAVCEREGCGYRVRLTRQWASAGLPFCGVHMARMTCEAIEEAEEAQAA